MMMAAFRRDHPGQDGLDGMGHAHEVHLERTAEHGRVEIRDQGEGADPGAGEQDLDRTDPFRDGGDRSMEGLAIGHVRHGRGDGRPLRFQFLGDDGQGNSVPVDEAEGQPPPRQGKRGRTADPVSGPGEENRRFGVHRDGLTISADGRTVVRNS